MTSLAVLTPWLGPALLACIATRVFSGTADAPLVVVLATVAPLLALVRAPGGTDQRGDRSGLALAAPGIALLLGVNLTMLVELARLHGIDRWPALVAGGVIALVPLVVGAADDDWSGIITTVGIAGGVVCLVLVGATIGLPPWAAWGQSASRSALVFSERSLWVTQGNALASPTTLEFTEPHRVTALTAGTYRLVEHDSGRPAVRERRLDGGEALVLRPGDALVLDAGARVRFETGKRIPGPMASGVTWSQPRGPSRPRALVELVGLAVTLIGGALALIAPTAATARALAVTGPISLLLFVLPGAAWGAYAMYAAPDLAIGAGPLTTLAQLPAAVVDDRWAAPLVTLIGLALLALFSATACGLWHRTRELAAPWGRPRLAALAWVAMVTLGVAASWWSVDPWTVFLMACGFLASAVAAPSLGGAEPGARRCGALAGAIVFILVAVVGIARASTLGVAPIALVAAPIAWLTTVIAVRRGRWRGRFE